MTSRSQTEEDDSEVRLFSVGSRIPGTKSRTKRRRRRWARSPAAQKSQKAVPCPRLTRPLHPQPARVPQAQLPTTVSTTISASTVVTASQRKLSLSPYASFHDDSGTSVQAISTQAVLQAQASIKQAREEVQGLYGASDDSISIYAVWCS